MKIFFSITILFSLMSVSPVMGQTNPRLSLTDCITIAVANNPTLKRSELDLSRNELYYKQTKYNRLPSLNGNVSHDYNQGRSVNSTTNQFIESSYFSGSQSLNLSVPLFKGLQLLHDTRKRARAQEAGKLEFENAINELKLDVIEAYVLVLTAQDMLTQTEGQLAVTAENLKRATVLHREGAINPGDFYDLQGQFQSEQNTVENTKQALYLQEVRLASLLAIAVEELPKLEPLNLSVSLAPISGADLYKGALTHLPSIKALDWRMKEAQEDIKLAKSGYFPSLSLNAGIQSRFSSVDPAGYNYWQQLKNYPSKGVSLNLRVPIFNQMTVRTQVRLAKLNLEEVEWTKKAQENKLREETSKNVFNLGALQKNVYNLKEQEQSYQEAFRIAQVHFDAGNSNSVLFLTVKNKLDASKNQLLIKQYEWLLQKYINDYYAGTLDL
ncbi:TolC family protein [Sphingobacterium sp. MYb382]|uniref:TolC family protein n=1 Tax=Sphingobacterium sp. MYb382 TaxID=2745278 RepID=UPI0030A50601